MIKLQSFIAFQPIFNMRLLVLAAVAAVAFADVSHLNGYQYNVPASSYGVPQSSVTERTFALPTDPSPSLHLPSFEHQDFNAINPLPAATVSTTAAPAIDTGIVSSTTPAPNLDFLVSSTPAPGVVDGGSFNFNAQLPSFNSVSSPGFSSGGLSSGYVSSTPAPNVYVTSGSQENLNADVNAPGLSFNAGLSGFTTPAPALFSSTAAPTVSTFAPGLGLGSGYSFPGFGLSGFSTSAPYTLGSGALTSVGSNLFGSDAALNSVNIHGITSGGSLNDAFGTSSIGAISADTLPQPQQVSKHLYFYAAPEDPEPPRTRINIAPVPPPKKNVKVIFIKAPNPPAPAPINIAAPPQNEEKTIVYVLVKKPEEEQNVEIQTPPPTPPAKPEVYFIKYKTPQEAEHAIAEVQSGASEGSAPSVSADSITGNSLLTSINNETPVKSLPVLNYVSSTSTTPAPLFIGGISGQIANSGYFNVPEPDISQNLISSGGQISSLFSTGSPLFSTGSPRFSTGSPLFSTGSPLFSSTPDSGFVGSTTTVAPPLVPHVTYGPPVLNKK